MHFAIPSPLVMLWMVVMVRYVFKVMWVVFGLVRPMFELTVAISGLV